MIDPAVTPSFALQPPTRSLTREVADLAALPPLIQRWQEAIAGRDVHASVQAGEDYEAAWQAIEMYLNYRSLPLYIDLEVNTQFAIDDGLKQPQPDWPRLLRLAEHLRKQIDVAIAFVSAQPPLSPLFDDLVPLRAMRAQLLISRSALASGDIVKARSCFDRFTAGYPDVAGLIELRSAGAAAQTKGACDAAAARFADPHATATDLTPFIAALLDRYGFGLSLVNAAARTTSTRKTSITAEDRTRLTWLNDVALGLKRSLPRFPVDLFGASAGGATGPGSDFAKVQPALESKAHLVNTAATLRSALAAYAALVLASPTPSASQVAAANKTALEAVALAQQTLVGQFWTDPDLQVFLAGLPTS